MYIDIVSDKIKQKIADNNSAINKYPSDEFKSILNFIEQEKKKKAADSSIIVPDISSLLKIFDENGQKGPVSSFSVSTIMAAASQAKSAEYAKASSDAKQANPSGSTVAPTARLDLWPKLIRYSNGAKVAAENDILASIKPDEQLKVAYSKLIQSVKARQAVGGSLSVEEIFSEKNYTNETFPQVLKFFSIKLDTFGADELIRPAFIELYNSSISKTASPEQKEPLPSGSSPINSEKSKDSSNNILGPSDNAINSSVNKTDKSTIITNTESQLTTKSGELSKEQVKPDEKTNPEININLELDKSKSQSPVSTEKTNNILNETKTENTILKNKESSTVEIKETSPSVTSEKPASVAGSTESSINSNKKEKGGFFSKIVKAAQVTGAALNLPTFRELGNQASGLFGATGARFMSGFNDVTQSFVNKSVNSSTINNNSKKESSTSNSSSTGSSTVNSQKSTILNPNSSNPSNSTLNNTSNVNVASSNNILDKSGEKTTSTESTVNSNKQENISTVNSNKKENTSIDKSSPTVSKVTNNSSIDKNILKTENSTKVVENKNSNANNTSVNSPKVTNISQNQKSDQPQPSNSTQTSVNVDLTEIAAMMSRLEKVLISGIEVTIKDT